MYIRNYATIHCRVERRTKTLQKSVKFTRAESTTEKDKDRVCLHSPVDFNYLLLSTNIVS